MKGTVIYRSHSLEEMQIHIEYICVPILPNFDWIFLPKKMKHPYNSLNKIMTIINILYKIQVVFFSNICNRLKGKVKLVYKDCKLNTSVFQIFNMNSVYIGSIGFFATNVINY